jgi:hypothetical protein
MPTSTHKKVDQGSPLASFTLITVRERIRAMTKTLEVIDEAVRNPKHPFRKADNQPKKSLKHRYERRKIREYLHLADWVTQEAI